MTKIKAILRLNKKEMSFEDNEILNVLKEIDSALEVAAKEGARK